MKAKRVTEETANNYLHLNKYKLNKIQYSFPYTFWLMYVNYFTAFITNEYQYEQSNIYNTNKRSGNI